MLVVEQSAGVDQDREAVRLEREHSVVDRDGLVRLTLELVGQAQAQQGGDEVRLCLERAAEGLDRVVESVLLQVAQAGDVQGVGPEMPP